MSARKSRKGTAKPKITNASEIPLAQPDRDDVPKAKTLYEIAAERQAQLQGGQPFLGGSDKLSLKAKTKTVKINADGSMTEISDTGIVEDVADEPIGPFGQAVLYAISLTMVHFTLDVIVHQQYREEIRWNEITRRALGMLPLLIGLVYGLHSRSAKLWAQVLFCGIGVAAGCYLIYSSNELGYFAVMKRAPPLGTLWIWSVVEMRLSFALSNLALVGAFFWNGKYSL